MILLSLLFSLLSLIQLSLSSQQIQIYNREQCDTQLIDQFNNQKIQFVETEKSITIESQDNISLYIDVKNCNFERQIIFQNITYLTIKEMNIQYIQYLQRQILLQNITYLDIQEMKMYNFLIVLPFIILESVETAVLQNFEINKIFLSDNPIIQLNLNMKLLKIKNSIVSIEGQSSEISQFFIEKSHITLLLFNTPLMGYLSLQDSKINICSMYLEIHQIYLKLAETYFKGFYKEENQNNRILGESYLLIQNLRIDKYLDVIVKNMPFKVSDYQHVDILNIYVNSLIEISFSHIQKLHVRGLFMSYKDKHQLLEESIIDINNSQNILIENVQLINPLISGRPFIGFNVSSSDSVQFRQFNISNIHMSSYLFRIKNSNKVSFENFNIFQFEFDAEALFQIIQCLFVTFQNMKITNSFKSMFTDIFYRIYTRQEIMIQNLVQNDPSFMKKEIYSKVQKNSLINYYIDKEQFSDNITINFLNINADFYGDQSRFFDFYSSSCKLKTKINISNSNFKNVTSLQNGGCIRAKFCAGKKNKNFEFNVITIDQTKFDNCRSRFYGGAIFTNGILKLQDVIFKECQSNIGPAIVVYDSTFLNQSNVYYINNTSEKYVNDNIFIFWSKFEIDKVFQFQQQNINQEYTQKELDIDKDGYFNLTPGIFYMLKIDISAVNISQNQQGEIQYIYNTEDENFLFNLYEHLDLKSTDLYQNFFNINYTSQKNRFSYLLFKFHYDQQIEDTQLYFKSDFIPDPKINLKFKKTECLIGMEKILATPFIDKYECQQCLYMSASYDNQGCQKCDSQYLDYCYYNVSSVIKGSYRNEYTVDRKKIYKCKYNEKSCVGGEGIGNQLCQKGHIGIECKCCDIAGIYWNERFGNNGQYQCIQCSQLNYNKSLMITLFIFFIIIISSLINSNLNKMELLIKQNYLSKMNLMYFGSTFKNLGQASVYFKIFSFYAQILYYMKQQVTLSIPKTLLSYSIQLQNPMADGYVSLDCALTEVFSGEQNIEKIKLYIIILSPFSIFPIIMLIQLIMLKTKLINKKLFLYSAFLSMIYLTFIISYNSILNIVLDALFCHKFESGEWKSQLNLNVDCQEMQQTLFKVTIPVLISYCIGIPLFIFIILILNRKKLSNIPIMFKYGFLYREYKQKLYFWEIIRFFVRVSQVLVSKVLLFDFVFMNCANIIILVLYMISLLKYKPFQRNYFNFLEYISILINIVCFISLIIYSRSEEQDSSGILNDYVEKIMIFSFYFSIAYFFFLFLMIIKIQIEEFLSKYCQSCFCRRRRIDLVRATQRVKQFRQIIYRVINSNKDQKVEIQGYRLQQEEIRRSNQIQLELQEQNLNQIQNDDQEQQNQRRNEMQFESQIILMRDNQENQNY